MSISAEAWKRGSGKARRSFICHLSSVNCLLSFVLCILLLSGCTKQDSMYKESRVLMDTYCTITVVSDSKSTAEEAIEAGFSEIKKLEDLLNYFSDKSESTALGKAAGSHAVKVSPETLEIINKTIETAKASEGAFDPTIAPVIRLWDFTHKSPEPSIPSVHVVDNALKLTGFNKIRVDEERSEVFLEQQGMEIDLGGITKGYTADKAADAIRKKGIRSALVAIAGDIRGFGTSTSGRAWKVGIQDPRPKTESDRPWEEVIATLYLEDRAISTSGDYQRFFMKEGKRFHHILDPRTGFPAETDLISASVIAPEGWMSDGLSTGIFILGAEKGMKVLENMGIDGVLVDSSKKVHITKGLKGKIEILNKDYTLSQ